MRSVRILALVSAFLAVAPAFAQDNFPDVPANHWAYEALARMKRDGLLVGYPDGLYRGGRPASRYEMAVAMHAVYAKIKEITDGLDAQVRAVQGNNGGSAADVAALKDAIAALQSQLAAMRSYGADIADLKRASDTFELELTQLGVDVQAMKDELRSLAGRVDALEKKKPALDIGGELDLWGGGGHTAGDHYGLSRDGRLTGISDKGPQGVVFPATSKAGITQDLSLLSEAAITFATTKETGPKVRGTIVATNAFGRDALGGYPSTNVGFGNQSDLFSPVNGNAGNPSLLGYGEGSGDIYIQDLVVSFEGRRMDLEAGRVEIQATPWILQRIDNTSYFSNERWDDGKYTFDGAVVRSKAGPVKAEVYAGRDNDVSVNGVKVDTIRSGPAFGLFGTLGGNRFETERLLGANLQTSFKGVDLRGDYLILDANDPLLISTSTDDTLSTIAFDQVHVYGGEADFHVGRLKVSGGLRQTKAYDGDSHVDGLTGTAWDTKVAWASGRLGLWAQYRQVGLNYMAPGDWGRLGVLRNPTNIRGLLANATVGLTRRFSLGFDGEISHGLDNGTATDGTFFDRGTDIGRYAVRLDGKMGKGWDAYLYYEQTHFHDLADAAVPGDPRYQWYGVGVTHSLNPNTLFSLAYEQSAINNDYQTTSGTGGNDYRGGFLTSQVTVKF